MGRKSKTAYGKERRVSVKARYVAMLAPFIYKEKTRYYLTGIYIAPHPSGGVIMVTTDGHRMGIVHDVDGHADKPWICPVSPQLVKKCGARKSIPGPGMVHFIGGAVHLVDEEYDGKNPGCIGAHHLHTEYAPAIDGHYPNWWKTVPRTLPKWEVGAILKPQYLAAYQTVVKHGEGFGGVTIFPAGKSCPAVILVPGVPEFVGVQMPMRSDEIDELPGWLLECLPGPQKTEPKAKKPRKRAA